MTVRLLDELTDLEKLSIIPLSHSRIDTFFGSAFGCQAKYFYQYILKQPSTSGPAALLGNVVHSVLENEITDTEITETFAKILQDAYVEELLKTDPDNTIPEDLRDAGALMLQEFVERHVGETVSVSYKEMEFQIVIGNGYFRGFIDRIDIINDQLFIVDYKTGKNEVAAKNIPDNLQLAIYALAAAKIFNKKQVHASLYYLKTGRRKGHLFMEDDLSRLYNELSFRVQKIIATENFQPTTNQWTCKYCSFAEDGTCSVGAKRIKR